MYLLIHVTPIFKKGIRLNVSKYRTISLTSVLCKTMKRIMKEKITAHFDKSMLFSHHQHGIRRGKSCTTNMMEYVDILSISIEKGIAIDVLYTDFSKAFDTVQHTRLISKLTAYGIDRSTIGWIESFLANR